MALASRLFAPHYAAPVIRRADEAAPLHQKPEASAERVGDLEAGEDFAMLDVTGGWAWGYRQSDHLVGYVPASALAQG